MARYPAAPGKFWQDPDKGKGPRSTRLIGSANVARLKSKGGSAKIGSANVAKMKHTGGGSGGGQRRDARGRFA